MIEASFFILLLAVFVELLTAIMLLRAIVVATREVRMAVTKHEQTVERIASLRGQGK